MNVHMMRIFELSALTSLCIETQKTCLGSTGLTTRDVLKQETQSADKMVGLIERMYGDIPSEVEAGTIEFVFAKNSNTFRNNQASPGEEIEAWAGVRSSSQFTTRQTAPEYSQSGSGIRLKSLAWISEDGIECQRSDSDVRAREILGRRRNAPACKKDILLFYVRTRVKEFCFDAEPFDTSRLEDAYL